MSLNISLLKKIIIIMNFALRSVAKLSGYHDLFPIVFFSAYI